MARTRVATENWYICTATSRKPNVSLGRPRRAHLLMIFMIRAVSDLLEPCEAKVSRTVLRGAAGGDIRGLPGGIVNERHLGDNAPDGRGRAARRVAGSCRKAHRGGLSTSIM